jgi:hypothetical protein
VVAGARFGERSWSVGEPEVEQISTFEGGEIAVAFKRSADGTGYEIGTIFPRVSRDV